MCGIIEMYGENVNCRLAIRYSFVHGRRTAAIMEKSVPQLGRFTDIGYAAVASC